MRRRNASAARATYLEWLQLLERLYGEGRFGHSWDAEITAVQSGEPIIVRNGYEIDLLPPNTGPFCLEPDGTITPVTAILDPNATMPTVIGHRRPDGSYVD